MWELPELFDDELEQKIQSEAIEAYKSEAKIVDWMINGIQEPGLSAPVLKEFIKNRINESLIQIGFKKAFEVDKELLEGRIEVIPLGFMRGRNLSNCCIVVDEGQNITHKQMELLLGRICNGSKMIICGDIYQVDLKNKKDSGNLIHY